MSVERKAAKGTVRRLPTDTKTHRDRQTDRQTAINAVLVTDSYEAEHAGEPVTYGSSDLD